MDTNKTMTISEIKRTIKVDDFDDDRALDYYDSLDDEIKSNYNTMGLDRDNLISFVKSSREEIYFLFHTGVKLQRCDIENMVYKYTITLPTDNKFVTDDNGKLLSTKEIAAEFAKYMKDHIKNFINNILHTENKIDDVEVLVDYDVVTETWDNDEVNSMLKIVFKSEQENPLYPIK
jgi:hypothetical protein